MVEIDILDFAIKMLHSTVYVKLYIALLKKSIFDLVAKDNIL